MTDDFLLGAWTYRSFLNVPDPVDDFNKLRFGQGEMVFEKSQEPGALRGQLAFRATPPTPADARLALRGNAQTGSPFSVRFQGTGVPGTSAAGWIYDYVGYFVPQWPDGKGQRPALVGSVIRTVPHGDRPAGVVGSFIAVQREFPEPRIVIPLPDDVRKMLASQKHRLLHMVWHSVRNLWLRLSPTIQDQIRTLGWQPGGKEARPAVRLDGAPLVGNGSGEDFLFMHREMIVMVNQMMGNPPLPYPGSWRTLPDPGPVALEPDFSQTPPKIRTAGNPDGNTVPPTWVDPVSESTNRRIATLKTDGHYWSRMRWWDREFKNPQYLSTLTLGELGALLEFTVHNDLHMRWASVPRNPQTGEPIPRGRPANDIRDQWSHPDYDFLGEFYSSHVNPVFWRLHGWVDDRIEDWFAAHEAAHPGEVEKITLHGTPWFKKGKWVHTDEPWSGSAGHHHDEEHGEHGGHHDHELENMKKVVAILYGPPPTEDAPVLLDAMAAAAEAPTFAASDLARDEEEFLRLTWF